jgi:hypothetical protein
MNVHYESMNWRDRAKERKRRADELNDTLEAHYRFYWNVRTADLALRPYGVRLIVNDRVFHIYDGWPGSDRRKVSGSICDGRKLIWRAPSLPSRRVFDSTERKKRMSIRHSDLLQALCAPEIVSPVEFTRIREAGE